MPRRRSSTAAISCSTPSTMPARASRCSTASCICSPGTAPSSISTSCRRNWSASARGSTRSSASTPSAAPTGRGPVDELIAQRLHSFAHDSEPQRLRLQPTGRVIEIRSNQLPDGGFVTTYTDVTDTVAAEEARARANELLEQRVRERTEELTRLNAALTAAKAEADEANVSKTRFLAAASHDILQPLNAARLYATALVERARERGDAVLAENVDASLDAVEEILTALLDISRLDTGAMKPQWSSVSARRAVPAAAARVRAGGAGQGNRARASCRRRSPCAPTAGCCAASCRTWSRTRSSTRRAGACWWARGGAAPASRWRSGTPGLGIPASKQKLVFQEFQRLDQAAKVARGLGLGLSIVERIARVLDHRITVRSEPGRGSVFRVEASLAAPAAAATAPVEAAADAGAAARRPRRPRHRQRARDPRRHAHAARRLGMRGRHRCGHRRGARGARRARGHAGRDHRRLPSRRRRRARRHRRLARAAGAGGAGGAGDGRPLAGAARASVGAATCTSSTSR